MEFLLGQRHFNNIFMQLELFRVQEKPRKLNKRKLMKENSIQ